MRRTQPLAALVISLLALAVVGGALAWACTPSAEINIDPPGGDRPGGVQPGESVTVTGSAFVPNATVELRWNSAGGPLLATTAGAAFTVPVTIPAAQADNHTIVAVGFTDPSNGEPVAVAGQAFATVRIGPEPAQAGRGTAGQTDGGAAAPGAGPAAASGAGSSAGSQPSGALTSSPTKAAKRAGAGSATSARTSGREPTRGLGRSAAGAPGTAPVVVSDQAVIAGSVPAIAGTRASARDRAQPGSGRTAPATPSERSAFADAWSGFAAPTGASLATRSTEAVVAAGRGNGAVAVALLGLGVATLLGGALAVQLRRRRVLGR